MTVWTRRITDIYLFLLLLCLKNKVTFEKLLKLRGGKMNLRGGEMAPLKPPKKNPVHVCTSYTIDIDMACVTDVNCMDIFYGTSNVRVMLIHLD